MWQQERRVEHPSNVASFLPASVTKETSDAGLPGPRLCGAHSRSQAMTTLGTQTLYASFHLLLKRRVCVAQLPGRARVGPCVCACVYLKRTAVSDLHFWRTELPAWQLPVRRECSEGKLLKNKGFKDTFPTICAFLLLLNLDKTALEGEVSYRL